MAMFSLNLDQVLDDEEIVKLILSDTERERLILDESLSDVYGDEEPWLLFEKDADLVHYAFVDLKERNINNKINGMPIRFKRTAGCGFWQAPGGLKDVYDSEGNLIGFKMVRLFRNQTEPYWLMVEYSTTKFKDDYLICAIRYESPDHQLPRGDEPMVFPVRLNYHYHRHQQGGGEQFQVEESFFNSKYK